MRIHWRLQCEGECRRRYHLTPGRKSNLLRVRKYLNELLVDQLPALADVQRYMDEVTIVEPPAPQRSGLILEHVPAIHDALIEAAGDWKDVAVYQRSHVFSREDAKDDDLRRHVLGD
jgi:hypothetical protein